MKFPSLFLGFIFLLTATACSQGRAANTPSSPNSQTKPATRTTSANSTPVILSDTFFFGKAYVDANVNGELDPNDPPLEGARFTAVGWGGLTGKDGIATVIIPGGWDKPVTAKMAPPEGSGFTLIGPSEATLQSSGPTSATFLFAAPANGGTNSTPGNPALAGTPAPDLTGTLTVTPSPDPDLSKAGTVRTNLTYCTPEPGVNLLMDLYQPLAKNGPAPAIIYIHGGGWMNGSKSEGMGVPFVQDLSERGYVLASINYRLAPEYQFPAQIEDVKCAVRHLRANADLYGLDPQRIGVIGASAGGHLAALLGTSDESAGFDVREYLDQSSRVQAVVDLFGPADLVRLMAESRRWIGENVFGVSRMQPDKIRPYSPVEYITPDDPPFLIMHGDKDQLVPVEQSQVFYDALVAGGVPAQLVIVKNAGHVFVPAGSGPIQPSLSELIRMVTGFFEENLANVNR